MSQPAEVDDAGDAGGGGGAAKIPRSAPIERRESRTGGHGVHQVVGGVHAGERRTERRLVEAIALDDFGRRPARRHSRWIARQASDRAAAILQPSEKAAAD